MTLEISHTYPKVSRHLFLIGLFKDAHFSLTRVPVSIEEKKKKKGEKKTLAEELAILNSSQTFNTILFHKSHFQEIGSLHFSTVTADT